MNSQSQHSWTLITSSKENASVAYGHYETDFFALTKGTIPLTAPTAARLACDTAVWGYEQIRRRKYYWLDKKKLMKRIMRTTNIRLFQKTKEKKFSKGVFSEGVFCICGTRASWVSCFGNASVYEFRSSGELRVMGKGNRENQSPDIALGSKRYEWFADIASFPFEKNDTLLLTVGDVAAVSLEVINQIYQIHLRMPEEFEKKCLTLLQKEIPLSTWGILVITQ